MSNSHRPVNKDELEFLDELNQDLVNDFLPDDPATTSIPVPDPVQPQTPNYGSGHGNRDFLAKGLLDEVYDVLYQLYYTRLHRLSRCYYDEIQTLGVSWVDFTPEHFYALELDKLPEKYPHGYKVGEPWTIETFEQDKTKLKEILADIYQAYEREKATPVRKVRIITGPQDFDDHPRRKAPAAKARKTASPQRKPAPAPRSGPALPLPQPGQPPYEWAKRCHGKVGTFQATFAGPCSVRYANRVTRDGWKLESVTLNGNIILDEVRFTSKQSVWQSCAVGSAVMFTAVFEFSENDRTDNRSSDKQIALKGISAG
jgi:hypothetical protein